MYCTDKKGLAYYSESETTAVESFAFCSTGTIERKTEVALKT